MAEFAHDPNTGQNFIFDARVGQWRPASDIEVNLESRPVAGGALAALEGATGLVGLAAPEVASATRSMFPGVSDAGLVGSLGLGGAGMARSGMARMAGGLMADRVAARTASEVGGSTFKTPQGFVKRPSDMVPESLRGTVSALESGVEVLPGARAATDLLKLQRGKVMTGKLGRALGMTDEELRAANGALTPEALDPALTRIDDVYESTRSFLSTKVPRDKVAKVAEEAKDAKLLTDRDVGVFTNELDDTGDQLLELRSELRSVMRSDATRLEKKRAQEMIDDIQEIINEAMEGTELADDLRLADRRYKVWKTIDQGGALRGDGFLNIHSLRNQLSKTFGARTVKGGKRPDYMDATVMDLIDAANEAAELGPFLPSSGTTERAIAGSLVGSAMGVNVF